MICSVNERRHRQCRWGQSNACWAKNWPIKTTGSLATANTKLRHWTGLHLAPAGVPRVRHRQLTHRQQEGQRLPQLPASYRP